MKRRYYKQVRLTQFRAIVKLAHGNSFTAAAKALELATPSVWQQVRALEDEFGVALIESEGRSVRLTEHGQRLASLAEPIVHGFDSILEQFGEETQAQPRQLSIAAPVSLLLHELPSPILHYSQAFPDVELKLVDVSSAEALRLVREGQVDLAVFGMLGDKLPAGLIADHVTSFPFQLVCPPDHPLTKLKRLTVKSIARHPLIHSSNSTNTRTRVDEVFESAKLLDKLRVVCETSSKDVLLQFVRSGFGVTIVPLSKTFSALPDQTNEHTLEFRDASRLFGAESIVVVRRNHRYEAEHQIAFREFIVSSAIN
ncbi:LysR family transcriptional regulator [Rhodopirellula sp. MGV]|uniref:LysR family transcriptional regulator n=1 Tax=Rhodopirellula sp. MGV TaxID=2023130 RepID=UPI000B961E76|nr:LysR family transcriptional regulator [Rhodopirellula sp. MGV]OYP37024.1 hypothetical protein CGZ80_06635 [Rhodopirellula sp. MGV]PNY36213.1 LysR family transcriptional regulator [Rhodopirellula baltica]